jgi:probable phosphoglycerate mutase
MLRPTPFYYLRHGETDWNRERRAQGQRDVPLNETGIEQAHAARELLRGIEIATICTSPLKRAYDTACIVNEALKSHMVVIDDLKECGFGTHEGEIDTGWYGQWRRGEFCPDGAETYDAFMARALRGVNAALDWPGPVLIVAHAGVYWSIQEHGNIERMRIPNGAPLHHAPPAADARSWIATLLTTGGA